MSRIASTVAWVCVALWLGGMIFLFLAVQTLFAAFPRATSDVALQGAPALFRAFEKYQIVVAALALIGTFAWYLTRRDRLVMAVFVLLALAAAGAVVSTTLVTTRMERLRMAGESTSPQFRKLHGRSMMIYTSQAALLLGAAVMLPLAAGRDRRTNPEAAPA